jgi:hypothetical protein
MSLRWKSNVFRPSWVTSSSICYNVRFALVRTIYLSIEFFEIQISKGTIYKLPIMKVVLDLLFYLWDFPTFLNFYFELSTEIGV